MIRDFLRAAGAILITSLLLAGITGVFVVFLEILNVASHLANAQ